MTVGLSGTGDPHQVDLSWIAPTGSSTTIAGYNVYRAPSGTGSFAQVNSMDTQTGYIDSAVQSGQSYDYYVTSVDSASTESLPSNSTTVSIP
jgi:fibronectin type 3 domain-containing protein